MAEKAVEELFKREAKKLGARTAKFVSPAHRGRTDQILMVDGAVVFVEIKTATGRLSPLQIKELVELEKQRCCGTVLYGETGVRRFIADVKMFMEAQDTQGQMINPAGWFDEEYR